jgi:antibiotic biosynthesis monooxygenase (ABM) superfamily enzyme
MVLYVIKYDLLPDQLQAWQQYAQTALPRLLRVPGIRELRSYRPVTGSSQIATIHEFDDLAAFARWYSHAETQQILTVETRAYVTHVTSELWAPSPVVPEPLRPPH